ncbi:hypothetical protein LJR009_000021 [Bosea sp. LjRoot9]|uniref:hypothetical protein n=1 Tax=Bosea sp. LjRoot9 TaxID=3342341 RepID=UPI003ED05970
MDQAQKRGLARLMLRWPERRAALQQRFRHDQRLVELCEAYETACEAISYWSKCPAPVGPARMQEYQALASATEQDILIRLA